MNFLVINFRRLILTYGLGGSLRIQNVVIYFHHNKIPLAAEKGQVLTGRDPLYPGNADLEQAVATCLSSSFETELFIDSGSSQIDSRHGTSDTLVKPGVR